MIYDPISYNRNPSVAKEQKKINTRKIKTTTKIQEITHQVVVFSFNYKPSKCKVSVAKHTVQFSKTAFTR